MKRESGGIVTDLIVIMMIISLISITAYFQDLADGIATIVTAMLTVNVAAHFDQVVMMII